MLYVIEYELGPTYWLRKPEEGEDLAEKVTIELTDAEFTAYEAAQAALDAWGERLGKHYKSARKG